MGFFEKIEGDEMIIILAPYDEKEKVESIKKKDKIYYFHSGTTKKEQAKHQSKEVDENVYPYSEILEVVERNQENNPKLYIPNFAKITGEEKSYVNHFRNSMNFMLLAKNRP